MDTPPPHRPGSLLEVRGGRGSSVIVQPVPPDQQAAFLDWQRGVTAAAAEFPGYQTTDVYPPVPGQKEWVVVIHFDSSDLLQHWLDAPTRAAWIAKLTDESRNYRMKVLPSGFGPWVAGFGADGPRFPHWKMCLTVLLGLYPTIMVLALLLAPHTARFGLTISVLIGNACSIVFLEFLGMPLVNRLVGPWLRANGPADRRFSLTGLGAIVAALGAMIACFHLIAH